MECKHIEKTFKVVGIKSSGLFANFGNEVPASARLFLSRANEIPNRTETEIALFEPKKDKNHIEGRYYVGLIVERSLDELPSGMDYIELTNNYVTTRGKITELDDIHLVLIKWSDEKGYQRDLDSYIVELYHSIPDGEEEVEIFLPVYNLKKIIEIHH